MFHIKTQEISGCNGTLLDKKPEAWTKLWEKVTGRSLDVCAAAGCTQTAGLKGGHVWMKCDPNISFCYIVPICSTHNGRVYDFPNWFPTRRNTTFLRMRAWRASLVEDSDGCWRQRTRQECDKKGAPIPCPKDSIQFQG